MSFLRKLFKGDSAVEELQAPPLLLPQRNEPCWCGSGTKYKKCHLEEDQETLARIREKEQAAACSPVFG